MDAFSAMLMGPHRAYDKIVYWKDRPFYIDPHIFSGNRIHVGEWVKSSYEIGRYLVEEFIFYEAEVLDVQPGSIEGEVDTALLLKKDDGDLVHVDVSSVIVLHGL